MEVFLKLMAVFGEGLKDTLNENLSKVIFSEFQRFAGIFLMTFIPSLWEQTETHDL